MTDNANTQINTITITAHHNHNTLTMSRVGRRALTMTLLRFTVLKISFSCFRDDTYGVMP